MATESIVVSRNAVAKTKSPRVEHRANIDMEDAIPRRPVEVVGDDEKLNEEQVRHKAEPPERFFENAPRVEVPTGPGAEVQAETLLGFLSAAEEVIPMGNSIPIMRGAKLSYTPGENGRLCVEAMGTDVWTIASIQAVDCGNKGFTAIAPIDRSRNILKAIHEKYRRLVVGVDEKGICLGPHRSPFGGMVEDFPPPPLLRQWEARAAVPAFYLNEICGRVIPAKSEDPSPEKAGFQGVLLDFNYVDIEGVTRVLCTAVATNGERMHILRLPQMRIEVRDGGSKLPPTVSVPASFFRYLRDVVNKEWVGFEFSEEQLIGRGSDFVATAIVAMSGHDSSGIRSWRKIDVDYEGFWMVDRSVLESAVSTVMVADSEDPGVRIEIDGRSEKMRIESSGGSYETVNVKRFDGPPQVMTRVNGSYLLAALKGARSGLIRLSFNHKISEQNTSVVIVRGEDEQFKALVMPRL